MSMEFISKRLPITKEVKMNPEIRKFWEDLGGHVWVQKEPDPALVSNIPAYWFDQDGTDTRRLIAVPFEKELVYWIDSKWKWVPEAQALRLIRLKAFL